MNDKTELKPYQHRVKVERDELESKIQGLASFVGGEVFPTLDPVEQSLLVQQSEYMTAYRQTLDLRISRF